MFRKHFLGAAIALASLALATASAPAADIHLPGLGTIGVIGSAGLVGGKTSSDAYANGQATGWKSPELNGGNSTISGKYDSYGIAESGIGGSASAGGFGNGVNGFAANLNVASGALAATSGSLSQPGSLSSSSEGHGSGQTLSYGGGIGGTLK